MSKIHTGKHSYIKPKTQNYNGPFYLKRRDKIFKYSESIIIDIKK